MHWRKPKIAPAHRARRDFDTPGIDGRAAIKGILRDAKPDPEKRWRQPPRLEQISRHPYRTVIETLIKGKSRFFEIFIEEFLAF
jgi:hypothetical protein